MGSTGNSRLGDFDGLNIVGEPETSVNLEESQVELGVAGVLGPGERDLVPGTEFHRLDFVQLTRRPPVSEQGNASTSPVGLKSR